MDVFEYGNRDAKIVLIQPVDEHDLGMIESEIAAIRERTARGFRLVTCKVNSWNRDLSPWPAKKVFRGGEDFSGEAGAFLHSLLTELLPAAETGLSPAWRAVFGYSLAGLFSLWAMTKTDAFQRCASVSGSLWFDGFADYLTAHPLLSRPERVYLSLGDREEKAKNPRMQTVRAATEEAAQIIAGQGVPCAFELNQGGHFQDVLPRQKRAVLALL